MQEEHTYPSGNVQSLRFPPWMLQRIMGDVEICERNWRCDKWRRDRGCDKWIGTFPPSHILHNTVSFRRRAHLNGESIEFNIIND
jgi:hypothetical protein